MRQSDSQHWFTTSFLSLEKGAGRHGVFLYVFWGWGGVRVRVCVCVSVRKRMTDPELSWTEFDCTTYSMYLSSPPVRFFSIPAV